jgi:hypothetical protein
LPKVRLKPVPLDGGLNERQVRGLAEGFLRDTSVSGVIALTDLYPKFTSATEALETLRGWLPSDGRCHAAIAKHDFEAWLLVGWSAKPGALRARRVRAAVRHRGDAGHHRHLRGGGAQQQAVRARIRHVLSSQGQERYEYEGSTFHLTGNTTEHASCSQDRVMQWLRNHL